PLKPDEAQKAAESLKQGDPTEALQHQDQATKELNRLASELDKAVSTAKDPREAARQLARLEDGLKKRTEDEINRKDADKPLAERLKPLQAEQKAIEQAAKQLSVPHTPEAEQARKEAAEKAQQATASLEKQDARQAAQNLEQAKQ